MEYIKTVALFLIFISIAENVLAMGSMKKYIRLFCGIVLILIVLKPIGYLFGQELDIDEIMQLNELEMRLDEMSNDLRENNTFITAIEDNVRGIVEQEGFELSYILVLPDENNSGEIGGISISIKGKSSAINVEKISLDSKEENDEYTVQTVKISEKIASMYDIDQSLITINVE